MRRLVSNALAVVDGESDGGEEDAPKALVASVFAKAAAALEHSRAALGRVMSVFKITGTYFS